MAYGRRRPSDSVDINTVFRLASLSKTFTSLLTAVLVDEGCLEWDDRIIDYLPEFRLKNDVSTNTLTVRHVLSQSTGLPRHAFTNLVEEGWSNENMLKALQEVDIIARPGTVYSYQNVAYSIIEPVVEAATGDGFDALMKDRIFRPLQMNDASLSFDGIIENQNHAIPHISTSRGWRGIRINDTYYNVGSAGGINASISDMASYLMSITDQSRSLVTKANMAELFKPQVKTNIRWKYFSRWPDVSKTYYGLGWRILNLVDDNIAYHGGYVDGFKSSIAIMPDKNVGICVLTNGSSGFPDDCVRFFIDTYQELDDSLALWDERLLVKNSMKPIFIEFMPKRPYEGPLIKGPMKNIQL